MNIVVGLIIGTLLLWALTWFSVVLVKAFLRSASKSDIADPVVAVQAAVPPSLPLSPKVPRKKAVGFIDTVPTWAFIVINVLVLAIAGFLLGAASGYYFIGVAWKTKMWPGIAALILLSMIGSILHQGGQG